MSNTSIAKVINQTQTSARRLRLQKLAPMLVLPLLGLLIFLLLWQQLASNINTSLGQFPGPVQVYAQFKGLIDGHIRERERAKAFYVRQAERNTALLAANPDARPSTHGYTGKPTFFDQIITSLYTVLTGFAIASMVAIPLGIVCGLSPSTYQAVNPLIQIFKPISPLAWLPLVTMLVSALYVSDNPLFAKSFINSAITVALCCLWPTVVNTLVGVASIDKDLLNVSKVLRLRPITHVRRIVLPAAMPMMFTGLRVSLATGWMVLIAAEMLAQNPGLGKFIWDEFQNGSSESLGRIMVAVITIGLIGFMLDRLMLLLQKHISWDKQATLR